ncbi:traB domain-containing protein [Amyelois transitella]|uniref:traB domain-containing protein n=1 Tax=Amyelois transitella TaxID=680683 RepID=UPI00298FB1B0|nr:traB domain-containing protein [Amyelois transitella]
MINRTCNIIRYYNTVIDSVVLAKRITRTPRKRGTFNSLLGSSQRYLSDGGLSLPPAATLIQNDSQGTVVLLGTVHFSKQSVEDVSMIVKTLNPNAILVELCRQRVSLLELDDKKFLEDAQKFDARKMKDAVKGQNLVSGMLHAMLLKTYADIAKELGVAPGGEFRRAYQEMKRIPGCKLFLGDRPIQITIARAFQSLNVYELGQVLYHLTTSNPKPLDRNSLEKYKDRDFVQAQFEEITRDVPAFKKIFHVFVDERDKCLAYSLQECVRTVNNPRVLAVVGMGHVDGIVKYYGRMKQEDIVPLLFYTIFVLLKPHGGTRLMVQIGGIHTDLIRILKVLRTILQYMYHGMMLLNIANGETPGSLVKQNGKLLAVAVTTTQIIPGAINFSLIKNIWLTSGKEHFLITILLEMAISGLIQFTCSHRMILDFTIWLVMFGNGLRILGLKLSHKRR